MRWNFGHALALTCGACALLLAMNVEARATREAPPVAHSGGFGEPTCQACHFEADVNAGKGALALTGVPDAYVPGRTYVLTISLTHPALKAGGFQLTARHDDGSQAGTVAMAAGERARGGVTVLERVQYAHHIYAGTEPVARDSARWTIDWVAPASGGTVTFHVVGNGGNADASPLGDFIYATSLTTRPGGAGADRTAAGPARGSTPHRLQHPVPFPRQ